MLPDGWLVETGWDMAAAIAETRSLIDDGYDKPIFEATFCFENVLVRVDILEPHDGGWALTEVKASTRVGDYHLADIATQVWVARGCGINITKATVRHLAKRVDWRHPDIGSVKFKDADVTDDLDRFLRSRGTNAAAASVTLAGAEPQRPMGTYCYRPLACEFREHCSRCDGSSRNAQPSRS